MGDRRTAGSRTLEAVRVHTSLIEAMADAVIATDAAFRVTVWNPAAQRLYGYSAEEAIGRPARDLATFEGDASRVELEDTPERIGRAHVELVARQKSGAYVDVELIVTALRDDDGRVVGHLGIHRDVTERKRVVAEHRRLSAIVQNSSEFIGLADVGGRVLFVNEAGRRLVGLGDMEEARTTRILDFVVRDDRDRVRDEVLPAILAEGRYKSEVDLADLRTGDRIPVTLDGFRIDDPASGRPVALAAIMRDLRDLRRAKAELQRYEHQIDAIFASITDAFYALDTEFRFVYLNARGVEVLGDLLGEVLTADDFLGREVFAMFPGIVGTEAEHNFRRALREQWAITYDFLYPPRRRWFEIHVYPSSEGLAVYFREISDRKAADAARSRQARQAAAVAELGVRASRELDAVTMMEEAVSVVARTLEVELVAVGELLSGGDRMLLRAGVGWRPGEVGRAEAEAGARSFVGLAVATGDPVVCADVTRERWCSPSSLLIRHRVVRVAAVPIPGRPTPRGAFGVFTREPRTFTADEVNFLRAIANVLSSSIERGGAAQRIREARDGERRRIARALHDETLQELGVALARAAQPGAAGDGEVVAALQRVGTQIRAAVEDLRLGDEAGGTFAQRVAELVERHRAAAPACTFELVVSDVPDQLPAEMSADVLPVIGEALTNVRRHAGARRVEVRVEATESALLASVTDDGVGIGDQAGGGHGLAGMRERAELLGGDLRVVARPQGGTVVELRALMFAPRPPGERARVLLVDDHAAIREAIALAFADDGGFVVAAQAGSLAEARTMLDDTDVAIVDLALPDGDGGDLIAELRAANTDCQTLVLTAQVDRAATARAVEQGAAAVLSKAT